MSLPGPERKSLYGDLIYWLEKPDVFGPSPTTNPVANSHIPMQALLCLISGEWLTITEYIQTRLSQVKWEISFPEHFLNPGDKIDVAQKKLHIWRRLVPLYPEMLTQTLQRVSLCPCYTTDLDNSGSASGNMNNINFSSISAIGPANRSNAADTTTPHNHWQCPLHDPAPTKLGPINAFREDFARIRSNMEEYQQRIDRLTSVVTASISIDDSHRGLQENRNVAWLTWLATVFIPLSFTASLFSMQDNIGKLRHVIGWYSLTALLLASLALGLAITLTLPSVQGLGTRVKNYFRNPKR